MLSYSLPKRFLKNGEIHIIGAKVTGSKLAGERISRGPIGPFVSGWELARERKDSVPIVRAWVIFNVVDIDFYYNIVCCL